MTKPTYKIEQLVNINNTHKHTHTHKPDCQTI